MASSMASTKNIVCYTGEWGQYEVDLDSMSLQELIRRTEDLDQIQQEAQKRKSKRWSWVAFPFLFIVFFFMTALVTSIPVPVLPQIILFFFAWIAIIILQSMAIDPKNKKRFVWQRWLVILLVWAAMIFTPPMITADGVAASFWIMLLGLFFLILLMSCLYISMAGSGFQDIIDHAQAERQYLMEYIPRQIALAPLDSIQLKYGVVLGKGEKPLMEMDAVLLNVQNLTAGAGYAQPWNAGQRSSLPISTWFKSGNLVKDVEQVANDVSTYLRGGTAPQQQTVYSTYSTWGSPAQAQNPWYHNQTQTNTPKTPVSNDFVGRLIITNERLLFVGCARGFQVFFKDLVSYWIDHNENDVITFQSSRSIRTLATDLAPWVKLYTDRIMRDIRKNKKV